MHTPYESAILADVAAARRGELPTSSLEDVVTRLGLDDDDDEKTEGAEAAQTRCL
ncbi:hypothetical protein [Alloscardovia macacae]|uniref:hypothetical protein n=1 Tax=Alloscardovia macacae TaxID=1160091 RepID=UPI0015D7DFB4|nr:hypothetical protein [Alloscardovia macacae]